MGANPNTYWASDQHQSLLAYAAKESTPEIVKLLIHWGARDLMLYFHHNKTSYLYNPALHSAAGAGKLENLVVLLDYGFDVNQRDEKGRKASQIAFDEGYTEIAEFLRTRESSLRWFCRKAIEQKSEVSSLPINLPRDITNYLGHQMELAPLLYEHGLGSPTMEAAINNNLLKLQALHRQGFSLASHRHYEYTNPCYTLLMVAARNGNVQMADLLVKSGSILTEVDSSGRKTALTSQKKTKTRI